MHGHIAYVVRVADRLVAPIRVAGVGAVLMGAEIGGHYNDAFSYIRVLGHVWVIGWGYLEAAPAGVAGTVVSTKRKPVDGGRVPGVHGIAARCRGTLHSAWASRGSETGR